MNPNIDFTNAVVHWQKKYGRHDLPWQQDSDPYKIWLAEIMLQQTQVATVIPYYQRFLRRFPTLAVLARARQSSVLTVWSGLGYYARARNLHRAAQHIHKYGIPTDAAGWQQLPGVGRSTAAAVAVFAYNQRNAILDGNVKRVLARTHLFSQPLNSAAAMASLWQLAETLLPPQKNIRPYTQGLMDIGATRCHRSKPLCSACPLAGCCLAYQQNLTADYPRRTAKKIKPEKPVHFALVHGGGKILLQQQPASGIWGGLWSLPQLSASGWRQHSRSRQPYHTLTFRHEFTHYRLLATVSLYPRRTARGKTAAAQPPLAWHSNLKIIALPAPLRRLLSAIPPIANTPAGQKS